MAEGNTVQETLLTRFIAENYSLESEVTLHDVAHYWFEDRGIYHMERSYLLDVIRYDLARRAVIDDIFASITPQSPWQEQLWLQKTRAHFEISATIAQVVSDMCYT